MANPTQITINPDGFPSSPIDILCIYSALATVPGHRIQDNRLAANVILKDVFTELYTKDRATRLDYIVGSYTFAFLKAPEQPETPSSSSTNVL